MFLYRLAKYKEASKTYCPQCRKKTLVCYINVASRDILASTYGKCDREEKCGFWSKPDQKVIQEALLEEEEQLEPTLIEYEDFEKTFLNQFEDNLSIFLLTKFDRSRVLSVLEEYKVGYSVRFGEKATIFWQIDTHYGIRTGKVMQYDPDTGKRVKTEGKAKIGWVHNKLKDFNLIQCFFGEHLITRNIEEVFIVESEKTALIMRILFPKRLFLASTQLNGLNERKMEALKGKKINLIPDKGVRAYKLWKDKTDEFKLLGYDITCSNFMEEQEEFSSGDDVADYFLKKKL